MSSAKFPKPPPSLVQIGRLPILSCLTFCCLLMISVRADDDLSTSFHGSLTSIITAARTADVEASQLAPHIDFKAITRGVLGKHRDTLTDEQTELFQGEFEKSMITLLRAATQATGNFNIEVTQTKISEKRNTRAQAYADVIPQNGKKIPIIASVAKTESGWKVRNLIFDGVNLGRTYRNQFDQLMQANEGDPDRAIAAWAANTKSKAR